MQQDAYFSIGDFAKLCDTTRATLYHYEKRGLLSPLVNEVNGYRYYELDDYYKYMYIAHLTRIGYSLEEIHGFVRNKSLSTYLQAQSESRARLNEQREILRIRNERTQRGFLALSRVLNRPLNMPQINYRDEEYFLLMPFDGDVNGRDCITSQARHLRYTAEQNIDIQRHFVGFYAEETRIPRAAEPPRFGYVATKLFQRRDSEYLYVRPRGVYISMCYRGPFSEAGLPAYDVLYDYMKEHRFSPLTGLMVEDIAGPFITSNPGEYVAELSVMIESYDNRTGGE